MSAHIRDVFACNFEIVSNGVEFDSGRECFHGEVSLSTVGGSIEGLVLDTLHVFETFKLDDGRRLEELVEHVRDAGVDEDRLVANSLNFNSESFSLLNILRQVRVIFELNNHSNCVEALHSRIDSVDFNNAFNWVNRSNHLSAVTSDGEFARTAVGSSDANRVCPRVELGNRVQLLVLDLELHVAEFVISHKHSLIARVNFEEDFQGNGVCSSSCGGSGVQLRRDDHDVRPFIRWISRVNRQPGICGSRVIHCEPSSGHGDSSFLHQQGVGGLQPG